MNIVVLDGHTLNPGDLSWEELNALGACRIFERTAPEQICDRAANAEIILTNKVVLNREVILALPKLRYIGVLATGYNVVDTGAARERNIAVTNIPDYGTSSVAQHTFALILELTHHTGQHAQTVREGKWTRSPDFCYADFPLIELDGLTLGIIGLGRIGREVAKIAQAFGLRIRFHSRTKPVPLPAGMEFAALDEIFSQADIISLHCPLTPETKNLVSVERLALMKPSALLVNTSRGPLVDEAALADALNNGRIAGAALDVLSSEPPPAGNPLVNAKNCLITPHIGWATRAARARLMKIAVANIRAFLDGVPQHVVN